ncbi:MAG: hypothetical protein KGJ80_07570, partial [Chloroflexota bacterium]|nr:hypothetical protein [Chloroflexota bacterium]
MKSIFELLQRRIWLGPLIAVVIFVVGLGLGLVAGWGTVSFKASADDVAAAADSYSFFPDAALANRRLTTLSTDERRKIITDLYNRANANNQSIQAQHLALLAQALGVSISPATAITPLPGTTPRPQPSPTSTTATGNLSGTLIAIVLILLVVVLVVAAALIFFLRILPGMQSRRAPRAASTPAAASTEAPAWGERTGVVAPPATTAPGGLGHFVPQYTLGNDNYDTSYSLETPRGEFLGECGIGISETIGEGKPDKVTAFDLWLFDKADVRTVTQILMSDYAFNDQTLRTKLATKGEAVLAQKGATVKLETQSLAIAAQIVELI